MSDNKGNSFWYLLKKEVMQTVVKILLVIGIILTVIIIAAIKG